MYLSTAIAYVNGKPHVGHAYELIVADAIVRHNRLKGEHVFFSTGTDEHGLKIQKAAKEAYEPRIVVKHMTQFYVDSNAIRFMELAESLNISYDKFVRTTSKQHKKVVEIIWNILKAKGLLYEKEYSGWYSVTDECLYSDDEIYEYKGPTGNGFIIPCTVQGLIKAKATNSTVERYSETNTFFKLSEFREKLLEWYKTNPIFPTNRANEIVQIVEKDLRDLSVSRARVNWGIPVPDNDEQTIYVWIDALANYLTAIGWPDTPGWETMWPPVHVIGKDILKFHSIYWPAMLMALELPLPKQIVTHGWILDNSGAKQAKSVGNVVDPFEIVESFGLDAFRFYLLGSVSFGEDGRFDDDTLTVSLNSLANNYGNLVNRILTFIHKHYPNETLQYRFYNLEAGYIDDNERKDNFETTLRAFDSYNFSQGVSLAMESIIDLNSLFQNLEPWNLVKGDENQKADCLYELERILVQLIRATITLQCIIPNATSTILDLLGYPVKYRDYDGDAFNEHDVYKGLYRNDFEIKVSDLPKPRIVFRKK